MLYRLDDMENIIAISCVSWNDVPTYVRYRRFALRLLINAFRVQIPGRSPDCGVRSLSLNNYWDPAKGSETLYSGE